MEKIINKLINEFVKNVDIYKTDSGSTWLIFTDNKQWVIELTESKTLWYNYNFFKNIFNYVSMDVVENQHYITKWVEGNIINGVKVIEPVEHTRNNGTKNVLKNGVKETHNDAYHHKSRIDGIIENGVKETKVDSSQNPMGKVGMVIDNGIKETKYNQSQQEPKFKEVLENGVIMSNPRQYVTKKILDDTIQNGIKETELHKGVRRFAVTYAIKNGVKD